MRRIRRLRARRDQGDAAEDVLSDAEAAIFQLSEKRIGRGFMGVQEIVRESFGSVDALLQRGQRITGLATHYTDLDEMTSGLQRSDLVIIAARPSMGKTAFAMNIAENAAMEDQQVVGVFSLEMSREALLLRLLCSQARSGCAQNAHRFAVAGRHAESGARDGATGARAHFHR